MAEEERRERLREEEERNRLVRGGGMSSLFAELKEKRQEINEGDEVFE